MKKSDLVFIYDVKIFLVPSAALALLSMLVLAGSAAAADVVKVSGPADVEIILDASGSMAQAARDGGRKFDVAKAAIRRLLSDLPGELQLGFRAYGHQSPRGERNCEDSELLVPVRSLDKEAILRVLEPLEPRGYTPIEFSLREAARDFPATSEVGRTIILVSDGEETCGGDPCKAAKELESRGAELLAVHTIGFDVDARTEEQLRCIAEATGGEYRSARDAEELSADLSELARRAREAYRPSGEQVVLGTGFGDAPEVGPGEYFGDILGNETRFLKVAVRAC